MRSPDGRCVLYATVTRRCTSAVGPDGWTCRGVEGFGVRALHATAAACAAQRGTTRRALLREAEEAVLDADLAVSWAVARAADLLDPEGATGRAAA